MGYHSKLCSCGESIKSPADLTFHMEWQNKVIAMTEKGTVLVGDYDGYGRVTSDEFSVRIRIPENAQWWHQRCYEKARRPDHLTCVDVVYTKASPDAPDQGFFYDRSEYHCNCGEQYSKATYAWDCRKCREYLHENDYANRDVTVGDRPWSEGVEVKILAKLRSRSECREWDNR